MTLTQKRNEALRKAKTLVDAAQLGGRDLSQEERGQVESYSTEAMSLGAQIAEEQDAQLLKQKGRIDELELRMNSPISIGGGDVLDPGKGKGGVELWKTEEGRECKVVSGSGRFSKGGDPFAFGKCLVAQATARHTPETKSSMLGVDSGAGYLSTPQIVGAVQDRVLARSIMQPAGARFLQLPDEVMQFRIIQRTGQPPIMGWTTEGGELPEVDETFGVYNGRARKLGGYVLMTMEAMMATNAAQLLQESMEASLAAEADRVSLLGSGAGEEPRGLNGLSSEDGLGTITGVGDVNYDDFLAATKLCRNANHEPSGAIYSPATEYKLASLKEAVSLAYLQPPASFNNLPKFVTTKCGDTEAFVGDFSKVLWVFGNKLRVETGIANYKTDMLYVKVTMFMDVVVLDPTAFVKLSGLT